MGEYIERAVQTKSIVACPKCLSYFDDELVEDSWAICPYCGEEVEVDA